MSGGLLTKTCTKCKVEKDLAWFYKDVQKPDGLASYCRHCGAAAKRKTYACNVDKERSRSKDYREANPEKEAARRLKYRTEHPEMVGRGGVAYTRKRRATDLNFKLAGSLRQHISRACKAAKAGAKTLEILGCSLDDFRVHIEKQFQPGMSWANYGKYGWHIDHIIACCKFDLTRQEEVKKCFHFSNLQPLWAKDNHRKGGK